MGKFEPRRVTAQKRREEAVELRMAGLTYKQIGARLGICESAAYKTIMTAMKESLDKTEQSTKELRALELLRLDRVQVAIWSRCLNGDLKALDRLDKIMNRRASLLGLNSPTKTAFTDPSGTEESEKVSGVIVVPAVAGSVEEWIEQYVKQPN